MDKTERYLKSIDGTLKDILKELKKSNSSSIHTKTIDVHVPKEILEEGGSISLGNVSDLLRKEL